MADENGRPIFAVVGDPIAHSLSPAMHGAAIKALGIEAEFLPLRTTRQAFPALIKELLENGGGCSVTRPFKDDAFALAGDHTAAASRTRAVNCIAWASGRVGEWASVVLDNTDVAGVRACLDELLGEQPVYVARLFGTGGASRAAAVAVAERNPNASVHIVSREPAREEEFAKWAGGAGVVCEPAPPYFDAYADVVISALPVGAELTQRDGDELGDPERYQGCPKAFLDLNYAAGGTPLTRFFATMDVRVADGRSVLLHQGVAAFERFFGVRPPVEVMRAAVEDALRP